MTVRTVAFTPGVGNYYANYPPSPYESSSSAYGEWPAIAFVDSASPLGALPNWPTSTAVVAGAKYHFSDCWAEVMANGTTSSTSPTSLSSYFRMWKSYANKTTTILGVSVKLRMYHGWANALIVKYDYLTAFYRGLVDMQYGIYPPVYNRVEFFVASSSACTFSSDSAQGFRSPTIEGMTIMLSVSKASAIPAYAAGASFLDIRNDRYSMQPMRFVRGVTFGRNVSPVGSGIGLDDTYDWTTRTRAFDCKFHTYKSVTYNGRGCFSGVYATRCEFKNFAASTPQALVGIEPYGSSRATAMEFSTLVTTATMTEPIVKFTTASAGVNITFDGMDMSNIPSALFTASSVNGPVGSGATYCKLSGTSAPSIVAGNGFELHESTVNTTGAEAANIAGYASDLQEGPTLVKDASVYRTGGASDANGSFSYKTTAQSIMACPLTLLWWNTKIDEGFVVTVEFQWSNPAGSGISFLSAEDVWLQATYLGEAGYARPVGAYSFDPTDRRGLIHNNAATPLYSTSTAAWTGTITNPVKQKMSITVNPRRIGYITINVLTWLSPWTQNLFTGTSIDVYICPKITTSAAP